MPRTPRPHNARFRHLDERLVDHAGRHDNPAAHARADQAGLDREAELADVAVPTLVVEAPEDPINPPPHAFARAQQGLAVTPIRFHDLRHTHATWLLRDRLPLKVVSERFGHSSPAFTMATYQHMLPGMQTTPPAPSPPSSPAARPRPSQ